MRITAPAVATLLLALVAARTTVGQSPASAKAQGVFCQQCQQTTQPTSLIQRRAEAAQAASYAAQQAGGGQQAMMFMPQYAAPGDVQLAGHQPPAAAYPGCDPNGQPSYGGAPGHPGGPFNGGHYGYFGGAHRTPGYPHHHLHREYVGPQGPPSAQVGYPYYTIRGPRDFLMDNPPSIGR